MIPGIVGGQAAASASVLTIISTNAASVDEDKTLAKMLTANKSASFSIVGGVDAAEFEVSGATLRWTGDGVKDYESPDDSDVNNTYVVDIRAAAGAEEAFQTITVTVADAPAPTITSTDTASVNENVALSKSLTADQTVTWSIVGGVDSAQFEISGSTLRWDSNGTQDYESPADDDDDNVYVVDVRATNNDGQTDDQTISVTVNDVASPTITSTNTATVNENATLSKSLTSNQTVSWSIQGGADSGEFEISGSTLRWLSNGTKDYESPDDANTDNDYVVTVRASNATTGEYADQTITVTVADVANPTITSTNSASVTENATLSKSLTANESVTWSIVGGADSTDFEISGSTLRWASNGTQDYESPADADTDNVYVVNVRATSVGTGEFSDQTISVTVTDIAWTPLSLGSNLAVWFKGDDYAGSNGSTISQLNDASGNARNFTVPAGSNGGTIAAADLNSLNTIRFTRTNTERYQGSTLSGLSSSGSIFYVFKAVSDPGASGDGGPTYFGTSASTNHTPFTDNNIYNGDISNARKTIGNPSTSLTQYNILGSTSAASDFKYYINGVQFFSTGTNTVAWATLPQVGRGLNSGGSTDGWVAEVIVLSAVPSSGDREKIEGYLAHKWGLTARLDSGHPYKSSPPAE